MRRKTWAFPLASLSRHHLHCLINSLYFPKSCFHWYFDLSLHTSNALSSCLRNSSFSQLLTLQKCFAKSSRSKPSCLSFVSTSARVWHQKPARAHQLFIQCWLLSSTSNHRKGRIINYLSVFLINFPCFYMLSLNARFCLVELIKNWIYASFIEKEN